MPTVESKTAFVAPALSAIPIPCIISAASGPTLYRTETLKHSEYWDASHLSQNINFVIRCTDSIKEESKCLLKLTVALYDLHVNTNNFVTFSVYNNFHQCFDRMGGEGHFLHIPEQTSAIYHTAVPINNFQDSKFVSQNYWGGD